MRLIDAKKIKLFIVFFLSRVIRQIVVIKFMDSFELNKIIAAVLLTALIIIGIGKFTDFLFHVEKPQVSAYKIEGIETIDASSNKKETKTEEKVDIAKLSQWGLGSWEKVFKNVAHAI